MKLFRSHRKNPSIAEAAAGKIAGRILGIQRQFDARMGRLTKDWKRKQQWIFLYCICLAFGGLSLVAIIRPFSVPGHPTLMPKSISRPTQLNNHQDGFVITEEEFRQVQAYKRAHPDLKEVRPSLLDSLNLIEQTYYSQKNK